MKEISVKTGFLKRHKFMLYDSVKELPMYRNHEMNKLFLQDAGIGSDMSSVNAHFTTIHQLLKADRLPEAMQEAINLHNNIFYIIEGINIKSYCFMSMIYSINGEVINEFTEDKIKETKKIIDQSGLTYNHCCEIVEDVKKKLSLNLNPTFLMNTVPLQ